MSGNACGLRSVRVRRQNSGTLERLEERQMNRVQRMSGVSGVGDRSGPERGYSAGR
jgi:hypothetical protein